MSETRVVAPPIAAPVGLAARVSDWVVLTKLRLASLVSFTAFIGALLADHGPGVLARALEAAAWITCSAAAGGA